MAKTIDMTVSIPVNAGAVRLALTDPASCQRMALAAGAASASAEADDETLIVRREIVAPKSAQALLKGPTIHTVERRTWGLAAAAIDIETDGMDLRFHGQLELRETGAHCNAILTGTVEAHVGFASSIAESVLRDKLMEGFEAELGTITDY